MEIIQVSSNRLGGFKDSVDVQVLPVGESRPYHRKHGHLNRAGNIKLVLDGSLLSRRLGKFRNVLGEGLLHIVERIPQKTDFIVGLDIGQFRIKITSRHFLCRLCELHKGLGGFLYLEVTEQRNYQQSQKDQNDDECAEKKARSHLHFRWHGYAHGPP